MVGNYPLAVDDIKAGIDFALDASNSYSRGTASVYVAISLGTLLSCLSKNEMIYIELFAMSDLYINQFVCALLDNAKC
jgi:hypothetical protein